MESQAYLLILKPHHVDFTLKKRVIYIGSDGTLEVAGVAVLIIVLSLENCWGPQKINRCLLHVSTRSCSTPSLILQNSDHPCEISYFWKEIYLYSFHPPTGGFVLHLDFCLFIQSSNRNIWHPSGGSSNNDLRENEVHHFFWDNRMEEELKSAKTDPSLSFHLPH